MSKKRFFSWIMVLAFSFSLLVACGGGGARTIQSTNSTTKGKELIDIKAAYDAGIINESEYDDQREMILDKD